MQILHKVQIGLQVAAAWLLLLGCRRLARLMTHCCASSADCFKGASAAVHCPADSLAAKFDLVCADLWKLQFANSVRNCLSGLHRTSLTSMAAMHIMGVHDTLHDC
jgi:hypothetical protein